MPQKPVEWRSKKAKREGAARMMKLTDVAPTPNVSRHAAKKSRYVLSPAVEADRNVGLRSPPKQSRANRRKSLTRLEARVVDQRPPEPPNEAESHRRPATVKGRKKPPSEIHVKRAGGPHKRLPLHGG